MTASTLASFLSGAELKNPATLWLRKKYSSGYFAAGAPTPRRANWGREFSFDPPTGGLPAC